MLRLLIQNFQHRQHYTFNVHVIVEDDDSDHPLSFALRV